MIGVPQSGNAALGSPSEADKGDLTFGVGGVFVDARDRYDGDVVTSLASGDAGAAGGDLNADGWAIIFVAARFGSTLTGCAVALSIVLVSSLSGGQPAQQCFPPGPDTPEEKDEAASKRFHRGVRSLGISRVQSEATIWGKHCTVCCGQEMRLCV